MWHSLSFVAESRQLDAGDLTSFALSHQDKYGIVQDRGEPEVNTWHVDQLVADFNASGTPAAGCQTPQLSSTGSGCTMQPIPLTFDGKASQGVLMPSITKGQVFTLRDRTFRVKQVIAESNTVYLEPKFANGRWAGWDQRGCLSALQAALAATVE